MIDTTKRLIPEGCDAVDDLTVGELNTIAQKIKADVMTAIQGRGAEGVQRINALAHLAWFWARRQDPTAKLADFLNLKAGELGTLLGFDDDDEDDVVTTPTADSPESA